MPHVAGIDSGVHASGRRGSADDDDPGLGARRRSDPGRYPSFWSFWWSSVFSRSVWATAIPSVAVPLSLVGTFGVMYLLHYSIDNLSLMALTISTGFVVDDAIVVIENISRYLDQGFSPEEAALRGAREIGFTVLSMSTSLIAVFIPILLMGGILGRIFREFAVTLSVAVAISMVVSLTTTPAMCAKFLRSEKGRKHNWLYRASDRGFQCASRRVREEPPLGIAAPTAGAGHHAGHASAWRSISTWPFPRASFRSRTPGASTATREPVENISFQAMWPKVQQYVAIIKADPAVRIVWATIKSSEYRLSQHLAQTARGTQGQRGRGHQPAAAQAGARSGRDALPDAATGRTNRRAFRQRAIPVHACRETTWRTCWPGRPWWNRSCERPGDSGCE